MKLEQKQNEVYTSNAKETTGFRLEDSPHAFRILSDGLYKYKIRAVIREYLCNAYDSHKMAKNTTDEISIHVPDLMEPWFEISDRGLGLSKEDIREIFTVYFVSTKTDTNDAIGCLGLGSKSGFAVSDQFTVTSIKDGFKYVYVCFMNSQGKPDAELKFEGEVDEPNGVTIRIPTSTKKAQEWQRELGYVCASFPADLKVKTNIGHIPLSAHKVHCKEALQKGGMVNMSGTGRCIAIMGNVAYTIEDWINYVPTFHPLKELLTQIHNSADIYMSFGMGEVDFNPNRENINMTEKSRLAIRRKLTKLVTEKYRELCGNVGKEEFNSFYQVYRRFYNTSAWDIIKGVKLPFTSQKLDNYSMRTRYDKWDDYFRVFNLFDFEKGEVFAKTYNNKGNIAYITDVRDMTQTGMINLARTLTPDIRIVYSEGKVPRHKVMVEDYYREEEPDAVFYCTTEYSLKCIQSFFGVEEYVMAEDILPEVVKKERKQRVKYGKLVDTKILCKSIVLKEGYASTAPYGLVDTEKENCAWIGASEFEFSLGKVPYLAMKAAKVTRLVIKDGNNSKKVERCGLPHFMEDLSELVKENFPTWAVINLTHAYLGSVNDSIRFVGDRDDTFLRIAFNRLPIVKTSIATHNSAADKLEDNLMSKISMSELKYIDKNYFNGRLGNRIKKFEEKGLERRSKIVSAYEKFKSQYPLVDILRRQDNSSLIHYLKLEKFKFTQEELELYAD